jgi:IPT/TIG domain-containing protein
MAKGNAAEKRKRIILVALGGLFAFVLIYQFILSGPAPRPARNVNSNASVAATAPGAANSNQPKAKPRPSTSEQELIIEAQLNDLTPLNLSALRPAGGSTASGERGPIFAYYVAPPPPAQPPPPPPPIGLQSVQPGSAVAGTPRNVTLTVTGTKIPEDAQIYLDGSPRESKRVSESQISTELKPGDYAAARTINIEVKSKSDPAHNNSNSIQFISQAPPEPGIRYIGRLGENGVFEITVTKEVKRLRRGDMISGVWRIDSISDTGVELTHTQYEIKRRVPMQEKTK